MSKKATKNQSKDYTEDDIQKMDWMSTRERQKRFPLVHPDNIDLWGNPNEVIQLIKIQMREEIVRAIKGCGKRYKGVIERYNRDFEPMVTSIQLTREVLCDALNEACVEGKE